MSPTPDIIRGVGNVIGVVFVYPFLVAASFLLGIGEGAWVGLGFIFDEEVVGGEKR